MVWECQKNLSLYSYQPSRSLRTDHCLGPGHVGVKTKKVNHLPPSAGIKCRLKTDPGGDVLGLAARRPYLCPGSWTW